MVRGPCCEKTGLNKGKWTPEEDRRLIGYIQKHGHENWHVLPRKAGLLRCGKSCRLRWVNYLRPDIKRGNYTTEEEDIIIDLNKSLGNRWSAIAAKLPGRTDNEIKNHWHTHLKKQLKQTPTAPKEKPKSMEIAECNAIVKKALQVSDNKSDVTIHPTTENSSTPPEYLNLSPDNASCADENISIDDKSQHTDSTKIAVESNENSISESSSSLESFGLQEDFLGTVADSELQFPFSPLASQENLSPNCPRNDSMEFWLNILMETTKLPEI